MARIRSVKPEAFAHEELSELEESHPELHPMLVFLGLMTQADKAGRFEWRPKRLHLGVLPFLDFDLEASMTLLVSRGLLRRYEVAGKPYGWFPTWERHQKPHHQEPESTLPPPPEFSEALQPPPPPTPKPVGDSPKPFDREREREREREGEREGEGERTAPERPAAAAPSGTLPEWLEAELQRFGVTGRAARQLGDRLGARGVQAALAKLRLRPGKGNPAGLLVTHGEELAAEGQALLEKNLSQAMCQAPQALADPRWLALPPEVREDLECKAGWAVWQGAEAYRKTCGEVQRIDAEAVAFRAESIVADLILDRHPQAGALKHLVDEALETVPPGLRNRARRAALWRALEGLRAGLRPASGGN